jgi:hypothetical protein
MIDVVRLRSSKFVEIPMAEVYFFKNYVTEINLLIALEKF